MLKENFRTVYRLDGLSLGLPMTSKHWLLISDVISNLMTVDNDVAPVMRMCIINYKTTNDNASVYEVRLID